MCLLPASTLARLSRLGSFNFAQIATFELTNYYGGWALGLKLMLLYIIRAS